MSIPIRRDITIPLTEVRFAFSRSGGPGGQNVNKVATRVELFFDVRASRSLTDWQKARVLDRLSSRIDKDGVLRLAAQESRSQWMNRETVVTKFADALRKALTVATRRVNTRPTVASRERRFHAKKVRGKRKQLRGRVNPE
jgi:ribosome-associated protein